MRRTRDTRLDASPGFQPQQWPAPSQKQLTKISMELMFFNCGNVKKQMEQIYI